MRHAVALSNTLKVVNAVNSLLCTLRLFGCVAPLKDA